MIFHETDERKDWYGLSFEHPSKGVVISDGNGLGMVLWAVGAHLLFEIEECGFRMLGDLGLEDAPPGVSVWEGKYLWYPGSYEHPTEGDMLPHGTFRPPTPEEWESIRAGRCPWEDEDLKKINAVVDEEG